MIRSLVSMLVVMPALAVAFAVAFDLNVRRFMLAPVLLLVASCGVPTLCAVIEPRQPMWDQGPMACLRPAPWRSRRGARAFTSAM
ncbi:MAG TPA: hypothetical protein VIY30_13855 [Burkholderiaceae bacterium]